MRSVFLLAVLSAGCAVEVGEADTEMTEDADDDIDTSSRVALNGMTASTSSLVSTDTSQLRTLANGSLASAGSRVPSLFSTATGRDQFAYLYSCAENSGRSLTISVKGVSYTFTGAIGLAPEWVNTSLTSNKYQLMTACMMARTSYKGVEVQISMRSTRLATTAMERAGYTVVEGSFWGDAFTPGSPLRACASPTKLSGANVSTLRLRECTVSTDGVTTKCGFSYAGECSKVCVTDLTKNLGYSSCEGNANSIAVYVASP